jgi:hypothetical protein
MWKHDQICSQQIAGLKETTLEEEIEKTSHERF